MSVFRSAIESNDGGVDAGYLALYMVMVIVVGAIPFMCVVAAVAMYLDPEHKFALQELGIAVGAVCTGFGVAVGAVGAFRMGDKPHPNTVIKSESSTSTAVTAPETAAKTTRRR